MTEIFDAALLLERTELSVADNANCCGDCPDENVDPPANSDCPYFDVVNNIPVCTKEGNTQKQLENFLKGGGISNIACLDLVQTAETGNDLPDTYPII